jgi:hypothetical protein
MILKQRIEHFFDIMNRPRERIYFLLKCDVCNKEFESRYNVTKIKNAKTHSCSKECKRISQKKGSVCAQNKIENCLKKHGVENIFQDVHCKEKIKSTMIERYGVEYPLQSQIFQEKFKSTMIERYGVPTAMQSEEITQRQHNTMLQNWGVEYPMQIHHVLQAMMSGSLEKHGVPFVMQSESYRKHFFNNRKNYNSWMSKPEKEFRIILEEYFGKHDIKVQQIIDNKWSLDFYIISINTYVSFDGVYWHGLDRNIEIIKEFKTSCDQAIYKKWLKDRELDDYVNNNKIRLVRITDFEYFKDKDACLQKILPN